MIKTLYFFALSLLLFSCKENHSAHDPENEPNTDTKHQEKNILDQKGNDQLRPVYKVQDSVTIDGMVKETSWNTAKFYNLDQNWVGPKITDKDFQGRYKMLWDKGTLYILAEIKDDTLIDIHDDPFDKWWDDDCLEVFVDADNSGGEHQYNHNAFAYHIALDGNVVDYGPDKKPHYYNKIVQSKRQTNGHITIWEVKLQLYPDTYTDENNRAKALVLNEGKKIGFALAYCDNDTSQTRENFIGSVNVKGNDKNRGWIDAGVFGTIELKEEGVGI